MRFRESYNLPVPVDVAAERFADPATFAQAAQRLSASAHEESVTPRGEGFRLDASMSVPTTDFPKAVATFVGPTLRIRYLQDWSAPDASGGRTANMDISLASLPLKCSGSLVLAPAGAASATLTVDGTVLSDVPFMGPKIEEAAAPAVREAVDTYVAVVAEGAPAG